MGKLTIQEIAKILVEKNKLTAKEASQFAAIMFDVIQQGLESEGLVKIKGLGTFKMIRVEARESISVRTGERVLINSHAKITFTPDATMKELVNKPFSQFETVVLNDGVEFEDMTDDLTEEELAEEEMMTEEAPATDEPVVENEPAVQPLISLVEDTPSEEQEFVVEETEDNNQIEPGEPTAEEITESETKERETEESETEEQDVIDLEDEESSSWKKPLLYCLLTLVLMAASAYGGYWYGQKKASTVADTPVSETPVVVVPDSVEVIVSDTVEAEVPPITAQPQQEEKQAPVPEVEKEPVEVKKEAAPVVKKETAPEAEPVWKKYEAMDVRVRTGAYHIIGTDHEVTVRKGETLSRIARRELGEGMSCYIEVYNNLKSNAELKEGQTIKIPKLKWKKKRNIP